MANWHFVVSFIGFNILYFPMFFLYDMPRRIYTYQSLPSWNTLNLISTIGAFIFAGAQILLLANIIYTMRGGKIAPPNPWGATTPEWVPVITGASHGAGGMPGWLDVPWERRAQSTTRDIRARGRSGSAPG